MDLIDIFRTFHSNAEEYTFSSVHGTFSRTDHVLGHKPNLSKFKKIEIILSVFFDHNAVRFNINYKRKNYKKHKNKTHAYAVYMKPTSDLKTHID